MKPIDDFLGLLENRTKHQFDEATSKAKKLLIISGILTLFVIVAAIAGYLMIARLVTKPVHDLSEVLSYIDQNNDLRPRLKPVGGSEVVDISQNINRMIDNYSSSISQANEVNNKMTGVINTISAYSNESVSLTSMQRQQIESVESSVDEMSNGLASVVDNAGQAESHAKQVNEGAGEGKAVIDSVTMAFASLENDFTKMVSSIEGLANETDSVGSVLNVIKAIAEQNQFTGIKCCD